VCPQKHAYNAGHQDIKKAIACLLFGGSRKSLPDGMRLRGDINVLLLVPPPVI
jgi:DNA replication licensing factor MCM5